MPMTARSPTERTNEPRRGTTPPALTALKELLLPAERRAGTQRRLQDFFERTAAAQRDNLALICGAERLTYADLDARANQLAQYLARHGVRPGDRVGMLLERSVPLYVALLGILKCGAAFVPLDPSFPAERVAFIAKDADLKRLLTAAEFGHATAGVCCPVTALDTDATAIALSSVERLALPERTRASRTSSTHRARRAGPRASPSPMRTFVTSSPPARRSTTLPKTIAFTRA